ncbi:hypothetical protein PIB30_085575, partial [Stylosanthes scabra]|nr:hypothetical protein [Stylosanthes scabra]
KSAHRPPPKPPNFTSDGDEELTVNNSTENGTVMKGKIETEVTTSLTAKTHESAQVEADNGGAVTQTWWCSSREDNGVADQNRGDCASEVAGEASRNAKVSASTK